GSLLIDAAGAARPSAPRCLFAGICGTLSLPRQSSSCPGQGKLRGRAVRSIGLTDGRSRLRDGTRPVKARLTGLASADRGAAHETPLLNDGWTRARAADPC